MRRLIKMLPIEVHFPFSRMPFFKFSNMIHQYQRFSGTWLKYSACELNGNQVEYTVCIHGKDEC